MIKNEREYKITKTQAANFKRALAAARIATAGHANTILRDAEIAALQSQFDELDDEISEYESLKSGRQTEFVATSFTELPRLLIKARIALGLTQRELAERLGLKEQQIQRYEATDYAAASLSRIQKVVRALGVRLHKQITLPTSEPSWSALVSRLSPVGIEREFLVNRLLPSRVADKLSDTAKGGAVLEAIDSLRRVYGWSEDALLGSSELPLDGGVLAGARFKLPKGAAQRKLTAYTMYAHYLAIVCASATDTSPTRVPSDASTVRAGLSGGDALPSLRIALDYVWSLGIPVLPLRDPGQFHGAFWRVSHRNVIVLKQRTDSIARWLHDLLHELWHAAQEPESPQRSVLEAAEPSRDSEEQAATFFASDVLLHGQAESIAEACVAAAHGSVERLKSVVPLVARDRGVDVGALANWLAYRLSLQNINWWGAATNLQVNDKPWEVARDAFFRHARLDRLNELDRELLVRALSDEGGAE